jgi:hypothetical protein
MENETKHKLSLVLTVQEMEAVREACISEAHALKNQTEPHYLHSETAYLKLIQIANKIGKKLGYDNED